jgi:hypothetical protein
MFSKEKKSLFVLFIFFWVLGCASVKSKIPVDQGSVEPGGRWPGERCDSSFSAPLSLLGTRCRL